MVSLKWQDILNGPLLKEEEFKQAKIVESSSTLVEYCRNYLESVLDPELETVADYEPLTPESAMQILNKTDHVGVWTIGAGPYNGKFLVQGEEMDEEMQIMRGEANHAPPDEGN